MTEINKNINPQSVIAIHERTLGVSGRIALFFQKAEITPLLAVVMIFLGLFSVLVTPREEEPQINVTMANVVIPFPGASVKDVEQMVAVPAEQVLSQIVGVEHIFSVSRPGLAIITVQYKVGIPRTEALVRLYDTINSNADWLPRNLGVLEPIIKPKGIDDVPIVNLTIYSSKATAYDLLLVAHSIESELKRVPGTREVKTVGGAPRTLIVELNPAKLQSSKVSVNEIRQILHSANFGMPNGEIINQDKNINISSALLTNIREVEELIVGVQSGNPIYLRDVANIREGAPIANNYVYFGETGANAQEYPAVTISISKKSGENAIAVADKVIAKVKELENTIIPEGVEVAHTRNYGETANDKAQKLIQKLIFATLSVVILVFFALGWREAFIIGAAVVLTLMVTLFASWAWGFTLNRVSLFALIFSIGILVDDAIVVVENIHRHQHLFPHKSLLEIIPYAVDEVGGPTILATFTVIAALLPMAFVSGLMGPYMSPIPINASMGMLLSLAIAFIVTPWMARLIMKPVVNANLTNLENEEHSDNDGYSGLTAKIAPIFNRIFTPLLDEVKGARNRLILTLIVIGLILFSVLLPVLGLVQLKMLPFDNKSEFQIIVDMPAGTPLEETAKVMHELGAYLATVPEVENYQSYSGVASPINFNGLVRQYYWRSGSDVGDIQVNLKDKSHRSQQSHAIAMRLRPALQAIGNEFNANVKIVEVPPGPPVQSPIVAEIYGESDLGRTRVAKEVREIFAKHNDITKGNGIVDIDDSAPSSAPRQIVLVNRAKSAMLGVSQADIIATLSAGLSGETVTYLHNASKYPVGIMLQLPAQSLGNINELLQLSVKTNQGEMVALRELITLTDSLKEQPIYHKDLLPVNYVVADMAGEVDSPLYGLFAVRAEVANITAPNGAKLQEYFINQPEDQYREYAVKWDGEWQITYETFRDMGLAYGVGLIIIYLLVVAQFTSYLLPLIIMMPIPLTIIGVMPGHALLGSQYTATSMIGMIALAGIIVRNSILLVDFIQLLEKQGVALKEAVVRAAITRTQPIVLTGVAAMLGAFFILDDPIFNGLAISLIFGILVSTILTLVIIPLLYFGLKSRTKPNINL